MTAPCLPPSADFSRVDPRVVALLSERWARQHRVLPIAQEQGALLIATSDPDDFDAERTVSFATGQRVRWAYAPPDELARQIDRWYASADLAATRDAVSPPVEVQHLAFGAESGGERAVETGASVSRLVDQLLAEGIRSGASDIHLEPEEHGIAVRQRVDGVLRQVRTLPRGLAASLVSRIKILCGLDIADRLRPQDGRARIAVRGAIVDLRVSTLPVSHGEKVVVRVLDGSAALRTLDAIGVAPDDVRRIRSLLEQREGLVLVTGPTGSGKTTTLYAALREIATRGVNIVTVEDPIEYRLPGIVQVQVHDRAGLTFSAALRSIMRQDPDVILVGEIRDRETAEIAIQASLTGHLVLSSLHTNDAASAVTRLVDIGVPGYKIATAVKGVIAQRLIRRVCVECDATGCPACERTGYRGRLAIAEVLIASPEFERQVAAGAPTESIAECARSTGCSSMWESGMALVRSGATTADELRRVAAAPVSLVTEPRFRAPPPVVAPEVAPSTSPSATPSPVRLRIAWMTSASRLGAHPSCDELQAAAALLGGRVEVVTVAADAAHSEALSSVDAIVLDEPGMAAAAPPNALVVAFGTGAARDEAVRTLARDVDLIVPADSSGREVLASILALLRWRSRG